MTTVLAATARCSSSISVNIFFSLTIVFFLTVLLLDVMNSDAENYFRDAKGNYFLVKDVAALGDCAVLSVLCHPNFNAPLTDVQQLRRAVVSFARSAAEECSQVYATLKAVGAIPFQAYLEEVLQPRFWVGTEFFVWVTMMYGIDIQVHFLNVNREPQLESTVQFLYKHLPNSRYLVGASANTNPVSVLFHQYKSMNQCLYNRYNHFAMLLLFPTHPSGQFKLINDPVPEADNLIVPINNRLQWKEPKVGKKQSKKDKTVKKKSEMTKAERKQRNAEITSFYVGRMSATHKKASEMEERLKDARQKALELAEQNQVTVEELDLPIRYLLQEGANENGDISVVKPRSLTPKNCARTWIQRSFIIFIHLHPALGNQDVDYTCRLTGVKSNTLLGWLSKPEMVSCWYHVVASIRACDVLAAMPKPFREIFADIDENSTVPIKRFERKAKRNQGQLKIVFTGIEVSQCFVCLFLFPRNLMLLPLLFTFISQRKGKTAPEVAQCKLSTDKLFLTKVRSRRPGGGTPREVVRTRNFCC